MVPSLPLRLPNTTRADSGVTGAAYPILSKSDTVPNSSPSIQALQNHKPTFCEYCGAHRLIVEQWRHQMNEIGSQSVVIF